MKLPVFIENENNNGFYPDSENIPFAFLPWLGKNKLYHKNWLNKGNNPLRMEYYFAFEFYFNRIVTTLAEATEIIQKLHQLIEVENIKFTELGDVTHKKLHYAKIDPKSSGSSTQNPAKVKFIQFDFENITLLNDDIKAKKIIEDNNADVNQLFAYDFDNGTMYPNLKCKSWVTKL